MRATRRCADGLIIRASRSDGTAAYAGSLESAGGGGLEHRLGAVLVGIQHRARAQGITVALAAPRPYMSQLLRITGLDRSLPMVA